MWQSYHDRVTAEIPVVVSDSARLDMFRRDPMHDDDPAPLPAIVTQMRSVDKCDRCHRSSRIAGNEETVFFHTPSGFVHAVCDDRWDP